MSGYDPALKRLIEGAVSRLEKETPPYMARQLGPWLRELAGQAEISGYFTHPLAFPTLLFPRWLEKICAESPDPAFQADLVYSTINGYYFIRLIDNLMDNQATTELQLLPALAFFHTQFQAAYRPHFAAAHPFWRFFTATWLHSAEVTMQDAGLTEIDEDQFWRIAAQKTCAAKIPVAAVAYYYDRPDLIEDWTGLVDLFGGWHRLFNDLFDWHRDYARQTPSYFLSEGRRRKQPAEPMAAWVAREGFAWAAQQLEAQMTAMQEQAARLHSPELLRYLEEREAMCHQQQEKAARGLATLARILTAGQQNYRNTAGKNR